MNGRDVTRAHLCFGEVETECEVLPLLPDDVVVLLEDLFEFEELGGRECCPDALRLAEGVKEWILQT